MKIEILRRKGPQETPYWQTFDYVPQSDADTVATALTWLNEQPELKDAAGKPAEPIRWECSCLQKKCGACAMVINGRPSLACDARLSAYKETVRLEALKKFPPVADLIADRSILRENLKAMQLWFTEGDGTGHEAAPVGYEASLCLQCGCCLEVCPNFSAEGSFTGMAAAVPMTRVLTALEKEELREIADLYRKRVFEGCGKSLSCRNVCPAGIDIDRMLVNSNAAAVWKRVFPKSKRR